MITSQGRALIAYGRIDDGMVALNTAAAMLAKLPEVPDLKGPFLVFQAMGLIERGRYAEARQAADEAERAIGEAKMPVDRWLPPLRRSLQLATGQAAAALHDFQAARVKRGLAAVPLATEPPKAQAESTALYLAAGQPGPAEAQARQALVALDADARASNRAPTQAQATLVLGRALVDQGRAAPALPVLQQALALARATFDPERALAVADAWIALAQCQRALGDSAASARSLAAASKIHAVQSRVGEHHLAALHDTTRPARTPP